MQEAWKKGQSDDVNGKQVHPSEVTNLPEFPHKRLSLVEIVSGLFDP